MTTIISQPFSYKHQSLLFPAHTSPPKIPPATYTLHKTTTKPLIHQAFDEMLHQIHATTLSNSAQTFDHFFLSSLLRTSSGQLNIAAGEQIHCQLFLAGLSLEPGIRTSLISFYSTIGRLDSALKVFHEIPSAEETDVPTWNHILSACSFHGHYTKSLFLFSGMLGIANLAPSAATYAIMIAACASRGDIQFGKVMHAMVIKDKRYDKAKMFNSIISLYSKSGDLMAADKVFNSMDLSNVDSWNSIISGHEQNGKWESALALFRRMAGSKDQQVALKTNRITFLSVLSTISSLQALKLGIEAHARIIRVGLDGETFIGNSLINMYGKCSKVEKAKLVFDCLSLQDIVSWNSMLLVFAQSNKFDEFCELFRRMQAIGVKSDNHTLTILLGAFSLGSNSCRLGSEIHGYLLRREASEALQVTAYNAAITMYAKTNRAEEAVRLFQLMDERDSYTWNAMIDGYSMNGLCEEAILLFIEMVEDGLPCDHLTFSILLTACGRLVSISLGKQVHGFLAKYDLNGHNAGDSLLSSSNALVSMYSKCGSIGDALKVFQMMQRKNVLSWTAMISAFANHGMAYDSIFFFAMMRKNGIEPNSVTYLSLLTACAHAGLVEEGKFYFNLLCKESETVVGVEHYAAMVDLFGRAGQFKEAEVIIKLGTAHLGLNPDSSLCLWRVLLGACHAHKQFEFGVRVAKKILKLEPDDECAHVLLSNLYASYGLWEDKIAVRKLMKERGLKKETGCSWVEIGSIRHCFVAGDASHSSRKEIYEKMQDLDEKFRENGYVPMTELVLHDVGEDQKEAILSCHSEKLAVTFALLHKNSRRGRIQVFKNLRMCGDCHNWMKFASLHEEKEIIIRDFRRFHSFKDGTCSCGDYW